MSEERRARARAVVEELAAYGWVSRHAMALTQITDAVATFAATEAQGERDEAEKWVINAEETAREAEAARVDQVAHTDLVRAEYQKRLAAAEREVHVTDVPAAAALMTALKEECERQHARAEAAERERDEARAKGLAFCRAWKKERMFVWFIIDEETRAALLALADAVAGNLVAPAGLAATRPERCADCGYALALEVARESDARNVAEARAQLAAARGALMDVADELECESHPGWKTVWCNKCIEIDQTAWRARRAEARAALRDVTDDLEGLRDASEFLWTVLANVSGGDWTKQASEWQDAAAHAREDYFDALPAGSEAPAPAPGRPGEGPG